MVPLVRKLHIYSGLLILWALLVSAISGIHVTMRPDPRQKAPVVKTVPFAPPAGSSDRQIADLIREEFGFYQSKPVPDWVIGRCLLYTSPSPRD